MKTARTRKAITHRKLRFLRRPRSHPGQERPVAVIETHFAWVFLTDSLAYKLKKPMRQDVMDYRTLSARERGCHNELRLNRRLAPSVYLEVIPLGIRRNGSLVLGRGGRIVDWLVKMRRLSANRMLDRAIATGSVTGRDLHELGMLFARFYADARKKPLQPGAYLDHLRSRVFENMRELRAPDLGLSARKVEELTDAQLQFIARNRRPLGARGGRLLDGHGDLRPEHVFLGSRWDAPCVIDCLEFDPRLRRLDPAEELAFLALECRRLGSYSVARELLRGIWGELQDPVSDSVFLFYMSLRAAIRAKITAWHLRDRSLPPRVRHWKARADSYLNDSLHFARLALTHSATGVTPRGADAPSLTLQ